MRADSDDHARPWGSEKKHHTKPSEIFSEAGAVEQLEEDMSDGFLKQYISPLLICDSDTAEAAEDVMEDIFDRCQVLVLDSDDLQADERAAEIIENYMDDDIDLILAVGQDTILDISRYIASQYKLPFVFVPAAENIRGIKRAAVITINGQKKILPAEAPLAVYEDTDLYACIRQNRAL